MLKDYEDSEVIFVKSYDKENVMNLGIIFFIVKVECSMF